MYNEPQGAYMVRAFTNPIRHFKRSGQTKLSVGTEAVSRGTTIGLSRVSSHEQGCCGNVGVASQRNKVIKALSKRAARCGTGALQAAAFEG